MTDHVIKHTKDSREYREDAPDRSTCTPQEYWDWSERTEINRPRPRDEISDVVGNPIYFKEYINFDWRPSRTRRPFIVSRFYPHEKLIVDLNAEDKEDLALRRKTFNRLNVKYLGLAPGERLGTTAFLKRLKEVREKWAKKQQL